MRRSQSITNSKHRRSVDQKDLQRYKEHIETLERAKEILNSDDTDIIKYYLLKEIGCDRFTYGEWKMSRNGKERFAPIQTKMSHIWAIDREIRSFKHAVQFLTKKEDADE